MHARRAVDDESSVPSISSSKLQRRVNRASVLKKVIYLKRRCIRSYFVSLVASAVQLAIHGWSFYIRYHIIYKQTDLYLSVVLYLTSTIGMVIGSGICIYAMSRNLLMAQFISGKVLMTISLFLMCAASVGPFLFYQQPYMEWGYPSSLIEDCQKFPDYTFSVVNGPIRKIGPPLGIESDPDPLRRDAAGVVDVEQLSISSTTEIFVTQSYQCDEMVANISWFKQTYNCMGTLVLIVFVTLALSYIGIIHLYCIHRKGLDYSILPPVLVEPYTSYDELMKRNHSVTSIPSDISMENMLHHNYLDIEDQREKYRRANREFNINIAQVEHNVHRAHDHGKPIGGNHEAILLDGGNESSE